MIDNARAQRGQEDDPVPRRRGPLIVLLITSMMFTLGDGSVQILLSPHLQAHGLTDAVIGPVVAAYSVTALVFRFVAGSAYRAHRVRRLVAGGCVLQSLAFFGIANASHPIVFAVLVGVNGIGFAVASTGGLAAVMEMRKGGNAGAIMGWYTGCIGLGYSAASFTGGFIGDLLGLQTAITVLGGVPLVAAIGFGIALRGAGAASDVNPGARETDQRVRPSPRTLLRNVRAVGPMVFLAFLCGLHINLLSGVLITYFPLYGLAIGLSLTQIGILTGLHSLIGGGVRFLAPLIFKVVSYRAVLPWMVGLGSLATAALVGSPVYWFLAAAWSAIGLSRGILRVSSSALVMDFGSQTERQRGVASGVYMSGLDIGRIVGPVLGGVVSQAYGYAATFLFAGLGVPLIYFGVSFWLRLRRSSSSAVPHDEARRGDR